MKPNIIEDFQNRVLAILSEKINDFYLAGGTALSAYYFHHRQSQDLDFFTRRLERKRILEIINFIALKLKKRITPVAEQLRKEMVRIAVFSMQIDKRASLKIDFVEDYLNLIKPPKLVNGINVLSLEDIYLRKIYASTGTYQIEGSIGRAVSIGGRQEAKDLYDLYCLSHTFTGLSDFSFKYGNPVIREAIISWFNTYSRFQMKTGLLELQIKKDIDYSSIERHFKKEIDKILEKEVQSL